MWALSNLLLVFPHRFLSAFKFSGLTDVPSSSCTFPVPVLELAIFQSALGLLVEDGGWKPRSGLWAFPCYWGIAIPRPSQWTHVGIYVCMYVCAYTGVCMHTFTSPSIYLPVYFKDACSISYLWFQSNATGFILSFLLPVVVSPFFHSEKARSHFLDRTTCSILLYPT